ncbi:hypothetical protein GOBAR_AA33887 [Gossypium barbadense]|uniref:Uncharacterized protein n=1 Tax=Gossypium barbadense TaxID=3634 RepID=A0A2P5W6S1_GOSBA|nr:hypothetical protein GOBAR_AA33887 [Gossypium barbadense]
MIIISGRVDQWRRVFKSTIIKVGSTISLEASSSDTFKAQMGDLRLAAIFDPIGPKTESSGSDAIRYDFNSDSRVFLCRHCQTTSCRPTTSLQPLL